VECSRTWNDDLRAMSYGLGIAIVVGLFRLLRTPRAATRAPPPNSVMSVSSITSSARATSFGGISTCGGGSSPSMSSIWPPSGHILMFIGDRWCARPGAPRTGDQSMAFRKTRDIAEHDQPVETDVEGEIREFVRRD